MDMQIEVIARGLLIRGSEVLLCQNVRQGYWYLPGGHVEFGEAAAAALAREFLEECGLSVQVLDCLAVTEGRFVAKRAHHELNLVFRVAADPESNVASLEPEVRFLWHDLASLAGLDLRPDSIRAWLVAGGRSDSMTVSWLSDETVQF